MLAYPVIVSNMPALNFSIKKGTNVTVIASKAKSLTGKLDILCF